MKSVQFPPQAAQSISPDSENPWTRLCGRPDHRTQERKTDITGEEARPPDSNSVRASRGSLRAEVVCLGDKWKSRYPALIAQKKFAATRSIFPQTRREGAGLELVLLPQRCQQTITIWSISAWVRSLRLFQRH
jgi:hypothetical protein